jgi:hypothetical protein
MQIFSIRLIEESSKQYVSLQRTSSSSLTPSGELDVSFGCTHALIEKGKAKFFVNEKLVMDLPVESFMWLPVGERLKDIAVGSIELEQLNLLFKDTFQYEVKVTTPKMAAVDQSYQVRVIAHCVVLYGTAYYFFDNDGRLVHTLPAEYSEFLPEGKIVTNLRIWNPFMGGYSAHAISVHGSSGTSGVTGTSGTSAYGTSGTSAYGTSGTSGKDGKDGKDSSDGTSGTSGKDGKDSSDGTSGTSGTSGIGKDGTSGTSGISFDGTSGTSGKSGTSGISSNGTSGSSGISGTSGTSLDGTSGTSGMSFEGTSGTSGIDGKSGHAFDWQGPWDSTATYTARDVVRFNNSTWICLEENQGNDPSQHPAYWDMMIGNAGDAAITSLKFSLSPEELSSLKTQPLVLFKPGKEIVIDLLSAMLVFYPGKTAYSQSALGIYFDSEAAGGWEDTLLTSTTVKAWKATLFEGYEFPIGSPLMLRSEKDLGSGNGTAVLHVTFRMLESKYQE